MDSDKISIILPVFNKGKYITNILSDIKEQSYNNYECIIINDGSTDESGIICEKYAQKDLRFVIVDTKNMGVSHARNIGLKMATGKFITFVDADDAEGPQLFRFLFQDAPVFDASGPGSQFDAVLVHLAEADVRRGDGKHLLPDFYGKNPEPHAVFPKKRRQVGGKIPAQLQTRVESRKLPFRRFLAGGIKKGEDRRTGQLCGLVQNFRKILPRCGVHQNESHAGQAVGLSRNHPANAVLCPQDGGNLPVPRFFGGVNRCLFHQNHLPDLTISVFAGKGPFVTAARIRFSECCSFLMGMGICGRMKGSAQTRRALLLPEIQCKLLTKL